MTNSLRQLRDIKANILGLILNNVPIGRDSYYYNRYYQFGYDSRPEPPSPAQPV